MESPNSFLSDAVIHCWQSSIGGLLVLGVLLSCRRSSAKLRHAIGWLGLLRFIVPAALFVPVRQMVAWLALHLSDSSPLTSAAGAAGYRLLAFASVGGTHLPRGIVFTLLGAWTAVTATLTARWISQTVIFRRRVLQKGEESPKSLEIALRIAALKVGFNTCPVPVILTEHEGPGLLGLLSPTLIIPRSLQANLAPPELEAILIHEFIHLRRWDSFKGTIRTILLTLFWFDPVVWLLSRSISVESEKTCDEEVIRITGAALTYVSGIQKTVRLSLGILHPSLTGVTGSSIASRINSIVHPNPKPEPPLMKTFILLSACSFALLSGSANATPNSSTMTTAPDIAVFNLSKLNVQPKVIQQTRPIYPADMQAKRIGGEVVVDFIIDANGSVQNAFASSSSRPEFDKSAVDAVKQWKFNPGQVNGHNVYVHMQVPILYSQTNDNPAKQ